MSKKKLPTLRKKHTFSNTSDLTEIIRQKTVPRNPMEIEQLLINDLQKVILADEMNNINFYEIQSIDPKPNTENNFRSIHFFQDVSLIRGTKFHRKIKRTDLERISRQKLADDPGQLLLLQEMLVEYEQYFISYEQMEENRDTKSTLNRQKDYEQTANQEQFIPESDLHLIRTLDGWNKKIKEQKQLLMALKPKEEEDLYMKKSQPLQRKQSVSGIPITKISRQSSLINLQPLVPKQTQEDQDQKNIGDLFRSKMLKVMKNIGTQRDFQLSESQYKVNKSIEKYLHQGEKLSSKDFKSLEQKKVSTSDYGDEFITDYSVEGLKRSLHTLVKMQITNFHNASDQMKFYETQSNQIITNVNNRVAKQQQEIKKKKYTLDLLRKENHEIYDKLRQIENLVIIKNFEILNLKLVQLNEEFKQASSGIKDAKISNRNLEKVQNKHENFMLILNKQKEIEDDINSLKDSQDGYHKKMQLNNRTIEKYEEDIIRLQKSNKSLTKSLQGFLLELLQIGLDCRNTGLSWIIQLVWDTGEKIQDSNLPHFLDTKAKEFLITKTKKIIEIGEFIKKSHNHFLHYKQQINQSQLENSLVSEQQSLVQPNSLISFSTFSNSFALINSAQLRSQTTLYKKMKTNNITNDLFEGLTQQELKYIDNTMNQISANKQTENDIIYKEAQKRIKETLKSSKKNDDLTLYREKKVQANESIPNEALHELKERLLEEYADIQKQIQEKHRELQNYEENEIQRIVKEIDFKNYLKRFSVGALQVLAALFGYTKAEREIIKNGMMHK